MEKNTVIGKFIKLKSKIMSKNHNLLHILFQSKSQSGFSLLELVIAMFIMIILISVALPTYYNSIQHAREAVLKDTLFQMRKVSDQYTADKGKMPKSVQEIVDAGYLREKPIDPITDKAEWDEIQGEDPNDKDGGQGMKDIKSLADGEDTSGKSFKEY